MRVSMVIPSWNSKPHYMAEALASVAAQTRRPDEVLVVDDGSDRPVSLPNTDLPLRRIWCERRGIGPTRNAGVAEASGEVVHIFDDDDRLHPDFYATLLPKIEAGADIAYGRQTYIDSAGRPLPGSFPDSYFTGTDDWFRELLKGNQIGSSPAVFRRSLWEQVGGFTDFRTTHDWRFYLEAARVGARIELVDQPLVEYRRHPGQVTDSSRALDLKLECGAMVADTPVPLRMWWAKQHAVARWWLEASRVTNSRRQQTAYLLRGGWRRPRTALAAARGRWG